MNSSAAESSPASLLTQWLHRMALFSGGAAEASTAAPSAAADGLCPLHREAKDVAALHVKRKMRRAAGLQPR
jgi:hypothetical protein